MNKLAKFFRIAVVFLLLADIGFLFMPVIKTVQEGWKEKDEVDWTVFNLKSNNDEKVD